MAEDVRPGVDIHFSDKKRTIYPVSLRKLRKLNKVLKEFDQNSENLDDEQIDTMVDAAIIALDEDFDFEKEEDREKVENIVDIRSFNQLIAAAMGTDPNELTKMLAA